MDQYRDHVTVMGWPSANAAASQYKDASATDFLPLYEPPDDTNPLDRQAMELDRRFRKLGV